MRFLLLPLLLLPVLLTAGEPPEIPWRKFSKAVGVQVPHGMLQWRGNGLLGFAGACCEPFPEKTMFTVQVQVPRDAIDNEASRRFTEVAGRHPAIVHDGGMARVAGVRAGLQWQWTRTPGLIVPVQVACNLPDSIQVDAAAGLIRGQGRQSKFGWRNGLPRQQNPVDIHWVLRIRGLRQGADGTLTATAGPDGIVRTALGVSWTSATAALRHLEHEVGDDDLPALAARSRAAWQAVLDRVTPSGGDPLLHDFLRQCQIDSVYHPNLWNDDDGAYLGFDGKLHHDATRPRYHIFSGWDIYRTWMQWMAISDPARSADIAWTMADYARTGGGGCPRWTVGNAETGVMEGDPMPVMISSAHAFGADAFDARAALELIYKAATEPGAESNRDWLTRPGLEGWIANGIPGDPPKGKSGNGNGERGSYLYELAVSDFAISRLAHRLGDTAKAERLLRQAAHWRGLYLPQGARIRGHDRQFEEGSEASYRFSIPYDLAGVAAVLGGREAAIHHLDEHTGRLDALYFGAQTFNVSNEAGSWTPWAYAWLGEPWKSQKLSRRIFDEVYFRPAKGTRMDNTPRYRVVGDEDHGAMSSYAIFLMAGLFPMIPGEGGFVLLPPAFPRLDLPLAGRRVIIEVPDFNWKHAYIHNVTVNGREHRSPWLPLARLDQPENRIVFRLGAEPNRAWGADPGEDAPPNFPAKPLWE